ncbi:unnamed protein product [Amaranthus hypochondriacus]
MDVKPILPIKRHAIRKKHVGQNNLDDEQNQSPEELFRVDYFMVVIDITITSLPNRFEQVETFQNIFEFLFDTNKLKSFDANELRERCVTFNSTFSHGNSSDVNLNEDLYSELKVL